MKVLLFVTRIYHAFDRYKKEIVRFFGRRAILRTWQAAPRPCLLCGTSTWETLSQVDRYNLPVTVKKCMQCNLVMQNPFPSEDFLAWFYRKDVYRALYWGSHRSSRNDMRKRRAHATDRLAFLAAKGYLTKGARVLDFGSGVGAFVSEGRLHSPEVFFEGVDIGTEGTTPDTLPHRFNLITSFHVVEHLYNPVSTLQMLKTKLLPGGAVLIEVPDFDNLRREQDFHVAHVWYFTGATLRLMLEKSGFTLKEEGTFKDRNACYCIAVPSDA